MGKCVVCGVDGDQRVLMDPELFHNEPVHDELRADLCDSHYQQLVRCVIHPFEIQKMQGKPLTVPSHLSVDSYDYMGNPVISDTVRMKGELFYDPIRQLKLVESGVIGLYTNYVKHPRTYHMPYSPGRSNDDKVIKTLQHFEGQRVVLTEKYDGECTTMYNNYIHARSVDGRHHPSRDWVKQLHSTVKHDIPDNFRIVGENVYAQHSIAYEDLTTYFYAFQVWDGHMCLDWDATVTYIEALGLEPVKVLYDGIYNESIIRQIIEKLDTSKVEGVVLRKAGMFAYNEYSKFVCKWVRAGHIQTQDHWMNQTIIPNKIIWKT